MHESGALTWREVVERHHSAMVDELSGRLDSDLQDAVSRAVAAERSQAGDRMARACEETRRTQAESLNQALRRLRQAGGEEQILRTLIESCSAYTEVSVVLVFENSQARAVAGLGFEGGAASFSNFSFEIADAPAVVAVIDSRDPVVALGTEAEVSAVLAQKFNTALDGQADAKAYLFPVTARHSVVAMLIASGRTPTATASIELLCEAAGMRLQTLQGLTQQGLTQQGLTQPSEEAPLVTAIDSASESGAGAAAGKAPATRLSWDLLSPEDQKLHLQAQRMARVRVAEMRLYHETEIRRGLATGDIYGALQSEIDRARAEFLQNFLANSSTIVDYLHLEILRSLAHDDDGLLGKNYPGPMV